MFKKLIALVLSLIVVATISACGGKADAAGPTDLTGSWTGGDDFQSFTAEVTEDTITISVLDDLDDPNTAILYWTGTFDGKPSDDSGTQTSSGDTAKLADSVLGSTDSTKEFAYSGNEISFDFTIVGVTTNFKLHRN